MRRYRNERTGTVIETSCEIAGGGWIELRPSPKPKQEAEKEPEPAQEKPRRTRKK